MKNFEPIVRSLCKATTGQVFARLAKLGFEVVHVGDRRYAYREGALATSPMVVCHADTVVKGGNGKHNYRFSKKTDTVTSIALDDRLGIACMVAAIEDGTPLGQCAMLVCDEEETGNSSAQVFSTHNAPNWLVELDRRGTDVVCYDYETPLLCSLLEHVGFTIGTGSFSDICYLEELGVCGFNVGVGYHREHSQQCHAKLFDTIAQIVKLEAFLAKFGDVRLTHEPYVTKASKHEPYWSDWRDWPTDTKTKSAWRDEEYEDVDPFAVADTYESHYRRRW